MTNSSSAAFFLNTYLFKIPSQLHKQSFLCTPSSGQFGDDWQAYLIMQTVQICMNNTSPRLLVLLTSCKSWRWVRLCIKWHINYRRVNIKPLCSQCCFSILTWEPVLQSWRMEECYHLQTEGRDYFQCHFHSRLLNSLRSWLLLHQRFPMLMNDDFFWWIISHRP